MGRGVVFFNTDADGLTLLAELNHCGKKVLDMNEKIFYQRASFLVVSVALLISAQSSEATVVDSDELDQVAANAEPHIEHCDEAIEGKDFFEIFECGDELFETRFNALDGAGMNVGDGLRFTRVPRADLANWSNTTPPRSTGPNAEACNICHTTETLGGAGDGAGPSGLNVVRDPFATGNVGSFIQRNTPHIFGIGGLQVLAEEMTAELQGLRDQAIAEAGGNSRSSRGCRPDFRRRRYCDNDSGSSVTVDMITKGIDFGRITVSRRGRVDTSELRGVDDDLVVKPLQWKGNVATVRDFSRGAFHNELGMNPVEMAGDDVDGDFDNIVNEITIADTTAMAVYLAAQPRPTSLVELSELRNLLIANFGNAGLAEAEELDLPALSSAERGQIARGEEVFEVIGCAECHTPSLTATNTTFSSPSQNPNFREEFFPAGQNAVSRGVDPDDPITFNITQDQPDNNIEVNGVLVKNLGAFETDNQGNAIVRLYGDLKRHFMGSRLAENVDESGHGASVWLTKELWGLANTGPYLHDGRATTIEEAIIEHGGEARASRRNFSDLNDADQNDLLAFLNNLVLFFPGEEE